MRISPATLPRRLYGGAFFILALSFIAEMEFIKK